MARLLRNRAIGLGFAALVMMVAACGPLGGDSKPEEAPMPTLAPQDDSEPMADASAPVLLPTLISAPTLTPAPTSEPVAVAQAPEQQAVPPQNSAETNSFAFPNDAPANFNGGQPDAASNAGETRGSAMPFGNNNNSGSNSSNPAFMGSNANTNTNNNSGSPAFMGSNSNNAGNLSGLDTVVVNNPSAGDATHQIDGDQPVSVFSCPETTCEVIGSIDAGDPIVVVEESGEWTGITFEGKTAYVFGAFVTTLQQPESSTNTGSGGTNAFNPANNYDPFNIGGDDMGVPNTNTNNNLPPFITGNTNTNTTTNNFPWLANNNTNNLPFEVGNTTGNNFPFANNNTTMALTGNNATGAGRYTDSGGFSFNDSGFAVEGGNPLYDEPETTNNNNNIIGSCPPFLPNC